MIEGVPCRDVACYVPTQFAVQNSLIGNNKIVACQIPFLHNNNEEVSFFYQNTLNSVNYVAEHL